MLKVELVTPVRRLFSLDADSVTFTGMPTCTLPMSTSFTPALTIIFDTSATVNSTVPALKDETPEVMDSPISTFLVRTTPSIGATMLEPLKFAADRPMGMPLFSTRLYFSCAFSNSCLAAMNSASLSRFCLVARRPCAKRL